MEEAQKSMDERPNIILFSTDQHRWDAWGLANPLVKTPNLDRVFKSGIHFTEAVCQVPMCIPSRYSYMTGLYPSHIGSRVNAQTWQDPASMPVKVMAEYLREGGYFTIGCGKTHYTMGQDESLGIPAARPDNRGFERRAVASAHGHPEGAESARFWGDEDPEAMACFKEIEQLGSAPFPAGGEGLLGYKGNHWPLGLERTREGWATRCAMDFLEEAEGRDQPWFLNLSFDLPHAPFCTVKEFEDLYDNVPVGIPEEVPEGLVEHWGTFLNTSNFLDHWKTLDEEGQRAILRKYYALCTMVDHLFGKLVEWLEGRNELENTWFVFHSDHGESLGDRGRFSKYSLYESSVRVPLAIAGPGIPQDRKGSKSRQPAEMVDLLPTVLSMAGMPVPPSLAGVNLLGKPRHGGSFAEMHGSGAEEFQAAPIYMWRTSEWKLILRLPGTLDESTRSESSWEGELYHLETDPGEVNNRYSDSKCREVREEMTLALLARLATASARYPLPDTRPRIC